LNFYKHHLGDYDGATAHLSWDEDMAYTRLLRAYYRRERPIGVAEAYRLARASSKAQRAAVDAVLAEFFCQREDGWHNKRADAEVAAYQAQAGTNRRIAQGRSRQRTVNEPYNDSSQDRTPNQEPLTKNQEPERTKPLARSDESPSHAAPMNGDAVAYIPIVGGGEFGVSKEFLAELDVAYPQVDVPQTLREIRAWCVANPTKRKTARGAARFINRWCERVQNGG
jgi:uncharacterized protein YdaU (DUF1376 family)